LIKLSAVRNSAGYTIEEASEYCQVSVEEMRRLEGEPGDMLASMVLRLRKIYKIPIDYVSLFLFLGINLVY